MINPFTPRSEQKRISPYNVKYILTERRRQERTIPVSTNQIPRAKNYMKCDGEENWGELIIRFLE